MGIHTGNEKKCIYNNGLGVLFNRKGPASIREINTYKMPCSKKVSRSLSSLKQLFG